ncbi:MAG TPA: C-type lectin domain-containing protein [Alphaproteobacteria bacterium]|nr:C-type lectin domain-containing protein [Alphaproteobacteria bacterium]
MIRYLACLLGLVLCGVSVAQAQAVYEKPMYDPVSKSYFELVRVTAAQQDAHKVGMIPETSWDKAARFAAGRAYKGTKGRLAIIKSRETHEFILINLKPDRPAFIGLRYFCKLKQLRWINDEVHPANGFAAWAERWDQGDVKLCLAGQGTSNWMGVNYTGVRDGFRWVARGDRKNWPLYIVEYPTGAP